MPATPWWTVGLSAALAVMAGATFRGRAAFAVPGHLQGHVLEYLPGFLSEAEAGELRDVVRRMGVFPTLTDDLKFYRTRHEHVGEAVPLTPDTKQCLHPFLVPGGRDKAMCVLPGRIDVGRHFVMYGGVEGLRERFSALVSRVYSFGRYMFDVNAEAAVARLVNSKRFQDAARAICPADKQVLDPFQFNFIMQAPGQTVAAHIDAPYFWGASRFDFPQWLLAVMVFSGKFQDRFIDQVQAVVYFHEWTDVQARGGDFVYWSTPEHAREPARQVAQTRAASVVDGSKTIHAASVYFPNAPAPALAKDRDNALVYVKNEEWHIQTDNVTIAKLQTSDLRMSLVYRARCFASEEERRAYQLELPPHTGQAARRNGTLELDHVLNVLKEDLHHRGILSLAQSNAMSRLDLAIALLDAYVQYPPPAKSARVVVPINWCAASTFHPWVDAALGWVCAR